MANLSDMFPKSSYVMSGPLAGFMGGVATSYGLEQANDENRARDLRNDSDTLKYRQAQEEVPTVRAKSAADKSESELRQKLVDSGLIEKSEISDRLTKIDSNIHKVDQGKRDEKTQDLLEMDQFFSSLPKQSQLDPKIQERWKEWSGYMNQKHSMKIPDMYTPETQTQLSAYAQAAAAGPKFMHEKELKGMEITGNLKKVAEQQAGANSRTAATNSNRIELENIRAEAAKAKITDRVTLARAKDEAAQVEVTMKAQLTALQDSRTMLDAQYANDPTKRADAQALIDAKMNQIEVAAKAKVADIYEAAATAGKAPAASPSRGSSRSGGSGLDETPAEFDQIVKEDQAAQKLRFDNAPDHVKGKTDYKDGDIIKNPAKPGEFLRFEADTKKFFPVDREAAPKSNYTRGN